MPDGGPGLNSRPTGGPALPDAVECRPAGLPAAAVGDKAVPASGRRTCWSIQKKSGKWEADLLEHTDEDQTVQTWEQLTSLDEDED